MTPQKPKEIFMPKEARTSAKKRLPKVSSRRAKTARLANPSITKIDSSRQGHATSKQSRMIAKLRSPGGATIATMMRETGWQQHSVRGFLAGVVRKRLKLKLISKKVDGHRVYRIEGDDLPGTGRRQPSQRRA
jgi:hypothetical protein